MIGLGTNIETKLDFNAEQTAKNLQDKLDGVLLPLAIDVFSGVIQNAPTGVSNNLKASFDIIKSDNPNFIGYEVKSPLNIISYAPYVEFGTRKHMPPFDPIRRWVELKIQPYVQAIGFEYKYGRALPTRKGTKILRGTKRETIIRQVARAIQLSIAEKGTRAKRFMQTTLSNLGLKFEEYHGFESGYNVDVSDYLKNNFRL